MYKIVEKNNNLALHSRGYSTKEKAQERIDSGECHKYMADKTLEYIVIEDKPAQPTKPKGPK